MLTKDMKSVASRLTPLADKMPVQRAPADQPETLVQFSMELRKSLRRQLDQLAVDSDMTMRSFVLRALQAQGLDVQPDDLLDLRRKRAFWQGRAG